MGVGAPVRALIGASRFLLLLLAIAAGALLCLVGGLLSRRRFAKLARWWSILMLKLLGVAGRYRGAMRVGGALLLSNHISWLDGLVFGARWRVIFLGNHRLANWFVLGWMFKRAGMLFIERGKGAQQALGQLRAALQQGHTVVLFPEGKTTDGKTVLRFQPRLLQAAIAAPAPVQAAALRYLDTAGRRVVHCSFAGDVTLRQSVWRCLTGPKVVAEITLFAPLPPSTDRQALAQRAHRLVAAVVESGPREPCDSRAEADGRMEIEHAE